MWVQPQWEGVEGGIMKMRMLRASLKVVWKSCFWSHKTKTMTWLITKFLNSDIFIAIIPFTRCINHTWFHWQRLLKGRKKLSSYHNNDTSFTVFSIQVTQNTMKFFFLSLHAAVNSHPTHSQTLCIYTAFASYWTSLLQEGSSNFDLRKNKNLRK